MPAIHVRDLSFNYSKAVPIFERISFSLGRGWTGVVGPNGGGKTTLLGLIDGSVAATQGALLVDPPDAIVAHCPQTADSIDGSIEVLCDALDGEAQTLVGRLGLERSDLERWETLSPGERKRWQVGGALYLRPDILLLDEPTNHLDHDARALLLDELGRFAGVGLVVSHDRTVLNRLCRRIVRVDNSMAELWHGSYDSAHRAWTAEEQAEYASYQAVRAQEKKARRRLADKRRATEAKTTRHKRDLRQAGVKDRDARSMEKKGRFEGGLRQGSRQMSLLRAESERLDQAAAQFDLKRRLGGDIFFDYAPARRRDLLRYEGPLAVGTNSLLDAVDVTVERSDRILLAGPNGAGKSTLLQALVAGSTLPEERVLYLPQELAGDQAARLVELVRSLSPERKGRILGHRRCTRIGPEASARHRQSFTGGGAEVVDRTGARSGGVGPVARRADKPLGSSVDRASRGRTQRLSGRADSCHPRRRVRSTHDADSMGHPSRRARGEVRHFAQSEKCCSSKALAGSMMGSQAASGNLLSVTKSAVMKTLATPGNASSAAPSGSSVGSVGTNVVGPPTGTPTVNFAAFGFGVELTVTGIETSLATCGDGT